MRIQTDDQEFQKLTESIGDVENKTQAEKILKDKGIHDFLLKETSNHELKMVRILLG